MTIYQEKHFEQVYNKYKKLVSFVVSKYIADIEIIKDITHDVFLNYIEHEEKAGNIQKYLTSTAKYMSLKYLDNTNNIIKSSNMDLINENINEAKSNINYLLFIEDLKKIISDEEIEIIILYAVYNYSFVEISLEKNMNYNNVKSIYRRAILKCREKGVF